MPHQDIRCRYGRGLERLVQILNHFRDGLGSGSWIAEAVGRAVKGTDARFFRDHWLGLVPNHRPTEYASHQNYRGLPLTHAVQVDTSAADIDQLSWLRVGEHSLILCRAGCRDGIGDGNVAYVN